MDYIAKNRGWLTHSKIKNYWYCPLRYKYQFIDEMEDITCKDNEALTIGSAVDDYLTDTKTFDDKYEVVARRSKEAEKIQLTKCQWGTIDGCINEFKQNKSFNQTPKKKIVKLELGGVKLKGEIDDYNTKKRRIIDIKTCANITTFYPDDYLSQMSFYAFLLKEKTGNDYEAMLEVVDKYTYFSRSQAYLFTKPRLRDMRGQIITTISDIKTATKTGLFAPQKEQKKCFNCPFYKSCPHSRKQNIITL